MTESFHYPSSFFSSVPQPGGQTVNKWTCRDDKGVGVGWGGRVGSIHPHWRNAKFECLMLSGNTQCKYII